MIMYLFNDATRIVLFLAALGAAITWLASGYSAWRAAVELDEMQIKVNARAEADRRMDVLEVLRDVYRMNYDRTSMELAVGKAWPPDEWVNGELAKAGETWTVATNGMKVSWTESAILRDD